MLKILRKLFLSRKCNYCEESEYVTIITKKWPFKKKCQYMIAKDSEKVIRKSNVEKETMSLIKGTNYFCILNKLQNKKDLYSGRGILVIVNYKKINPLDGFKCSDLKSQFVIVECDSAKYMLFVDDNQKIQIRDYSVLNNYLVIVMDNLIQIYNKKLKVIFSSEIKILGDISLRNIRLKNEFEATNNVYDDMFALRQKEEKNLTLSVYRITDSKVKNILSMSGYVKYNEPVISYIDGNYIFINYYRKKNIGTRLFDIKRQQFIPDINQDKLYNSYAIIRCENKIYIITQRRKFKC